MLTCPASPRGDGPDCEGWAASIGERNTAGDGPLSPSFSGLSIALSPDRPLDDAAWEMRLPSLGPSPAVAGCESGISGDGGRSSAPLIRDPHSETRGLDHTSGLESVGREDLCRLSPAWQSGCRPEAEMAPGEPPRRKPPDGRAVWLARGSPPGAACSAYRRARLFLKLGTVCHMRVACSNRKCKMAGL
jgi:hypothetical protein